MVKHRKVGVVRNPSGRFTRRSKKSGSKRNTSAARRASSRKSKPRTKHAKRTKSNPSLLSLGFMNPKGGSMAKKKKNRKRPASHGHRKSGAKMAPNPHRRGGGRRRGVRNPNFISSGVRLLKSGFFALLGFQATKQAAQWVLGAKNTGPFGYLANAIAAFLASAVAAKAINREAGEAVLLGGGLYVTNRVIQDQFSPVGKVLSLSGLGDPMTLSGIGPGYFPVPVPTDSAGMPIIPAEIRALPPAAVAAATTAATAAGLGLARTRFASRFAS